MSPAILANFAADATESTSSSQGRTLPVELISRILNTIPSTETATLAGLLHVSKLFCELVAPRVYGHVVVTPYADLIVDTGLPADLVALPQTGSGSTAAGTATAVGPARAPTFKARLLGLIRTLEIYPPPTHPDDPRRPAPLTSPAPTSDKQTIHLDTLIIRLDTSTAERASPLRPLEPFFVDSDDRPQPWKEHIYPIQHTLARTTARRLILHGAGFYQTSYPLMRLPRALLQSVQKVYMIFTPGPNPGQTLNANHGLPYVLQTLLIAPIPISAPLAVVLQPSTRYGRLSVGSRTTSEGYMRPHGNMPMTMEFHPDYAPGWLHALTTLFAREMAHAVEINSEAARREISFVNFGALDGEEIGMPQAAKQEVEDRFRRGLRIRLERFGGNLGRGDAKDWAKVVAMEDWLDANGGEGRAAMGLWEGTHAIQQQ